MAPVRRQKLPFLCPWEGHEFLKKLPFFDYKGSIINYLSVQKPNYQNIFS
jgi:hypothetical protein